MKYISHSEMLIMKHLWSTVPNGQAFRDILPVFDGDVAKQTVNTFITRLIDKGYVIARGEGRKTYYPGITRAEYAWMFLGEIFEDMSTEEVMKELKM